MQDDTCDPVCTKIANGRIRHLSTDVGFYLRWGINNKGLPTGCDGTLEPPNAAPTDENYQKIQFIGYASCPKQKLDDGHGTPLYKTAENFANNATFWINEFTDVFIRMQKIGYHKSNTNGYKQLIQGPQQFWKQRCK